MEASLGDILEHVKKFAKSPVHVDMRTSTPMSTPQSTPRSTSLSEPRTPHLADGALVVRRESIEEATALVRSRYGMKSLLWRYMKSRMVRTPPNRARELHLGEVRHRYSSQSHHNNTYILPGGICCREDV